MKRNRIALSLALAGIAIFSSRASAQAEVAPWGNIEAIRVEGQRIPLHAALCVLGADGAEVVRTAKSRQSPRYHRNGRRRTVTTRLAGMSVTEAVEDGGVGVATLSIRFAPDNLPVGGEGYLCLDLPREEYSGGSASLVGADGSSARRIALTGVPTGEQELLRGTGQILDLIGAHHTVEISSATPTAVLIRDSSRPGNDAIRVYLRVPEGSPEGGASSAGAFTVRVSGEIDRSPVTVAIDSAHPGERFDGVGGNFRLQHPDTDPAVIQYNLENLRVAWGRVEIPWRYWHPEEKRSPIAEAEAGRLHPRVRAAMEMAGALARRDIPLVATIWAPPDWAVNPPAEPDPRHPTRGSRLDSTKMERIYASIADYLVYLKREYGAEPAMFSFNEPERGIDVHLTPEEHAAFIRGFGPYLATRGLKTKLLLGDNANTYRTEYILPALRDPAARPYVGAVSFHSWGGWSEELLSFWGGEARKLGVPLLIAEASTDAWAWTYPDIFLEPTYAIEEIALYLRLLKLTQPRSILQWQLTSDFSILAGGGLFGDHTPLRPTQRFWNLKQLASTPAGLRSLPLTCGNTSIECAAFGDRATGRYAVHLVNNGPSRPVTLTGLPSGVRQLRVFFTDERQGMKELSPIPVTDGVAHLTLGAVGFTTLLRLP